ncbi:hypothetical protein JX265_007891 [Neoarthrinium moseri]|uniref:Acyl-CoA thioesterase II n=1 Tax=Neoarthrinium moseri TaxID=1658444 RepID=A0A9P9WJH9_9PEZI|nr:hypothetical protein JX265_007891 [Neoarthrinium moseri]
MATHSLLGVLTSVTPAPGSKPDIYTNEGSLIRQPVGEAAFGGSILSQAISAAYATVQPEFDVYSSQSSFLRPVTAKSKVNYHVERTADGRTFCTRAVRATQGGPCLYVATISFQKRSLARDNDSTLKYADPLPDFGGVRPYDIAKQDFQQIGFHVGEEDLEVSPPFDWRLLPFKSVRDPAQIRTHAFVRAELMSTRHASHLPAMALLSDISVLELSLFANWESVHEEIQALAMSTTLNSQISFHAPTAKIDEWMVCESGTSWAAGGRITIYQRFWNAATGELLMSCAQDAVIKRQQPQL